MSVEEDLVVVNDRDRRIMLFGDITYSAAGQIIAALLSFNEKRPRTKWHKQVAELWIHSGGGSPSAAFAIADVMEHMINYDLLTVGMGLVCSAAIVPLLCGHHRAVFPRCEVMMHGVAREFPKEERREDAGWHDHEMRRLTVARQSVESSNQQLIDLLVERAKWDRLRAKALLADGHEHWFFGGLEIVHQGLADVVLGDTPAGVTNA